MKLYHYDRTNSFPKNEEDQLLQVNIKLNNFHQYFSEESVRTEINAHIKHAFTEAVNKMGETYLNSYSIEKGYPCIREYILEVVRLLEFSNKPSRLSSIFICDSKVNLMNWVETLKKGAVEGHILTIETNNELFKADASWRDIEFAKDTKIFNPFIYHYYARQYWSGKNTSSPRMETICQLPVKVIEKVPLSSFSMK